MKKLITIISILTLAFTSVFAEETSLLFQGFSDDFTASNAEIQEANPNKKSWEKNILLVEANLSYIEAIYAELVEFISENDDITTESTVFTSSAFRRSVIFAYINSYKTGIKNEDFKMAQILAKDFDWLVQNNISYTTLKAGGFVYNNIQLNNACITLLAIKNSDYATFKSYVTTPDALPKNGFGFIKSNIMALEQDEAVEECKYWIKIFLLGENDSKIKELQKLEDPLRYWQRSDNLIK